MTLDHEPSADETAPATVVADPETLDSELVGGSLSQRLAHAKKPPLTGYPYLNFYTDEAERSDAEAYLTHRPLAVEIGFGRGHFVSALAQQRPDQWYVAFEIRRKWCEMLARRMARLKIDNIRIGQHDARALIVAGFADASISEVYVNFPDPWWKKRHHKRRLFSEAFLTMLHKKLAPGGRIFLKTDVEVYAQRAQEALHEHPDYSVGQIVPGGELGLPLSYREKRYVRQSIPTYGLVGTALERER